MSKIRKLQCLSLLIVLASISAGLLPTTSRAQQLTGLKVGYIPIVSCLPLYAAVENGYFEQEGLKVEMSPMAGGQVIIPAMVGGSLDIGFSAYFAAFSARDAGMDITIIAAIVREVGAGQPYVGVLVREDSGINKAKDLEGKTFATGTIKSVDWLTTAEWMSLNGADHKKVGWVEIPFPAMGGALRTKRVDAITGVDPFLTAELEAGGVKVIGHPFFEVAPNLPIAGFVTTDTWLKKNRSLAERFLRGINKGTDYVNARPEKRGEILVKYTRMKPELAAKLKFYPGFDRFIDASALQKTVDLAVKFGLASKRLDVKDMVAPGVLK